MALCSRQSDVPTARQEEFLRLDAGAGVRWEGLKELL